METTRAAFLSWDTGDLPDTTKFTSAYRVSLWGADQCAICGREGYTLVDHDHETHMTRGMLCKSCNVREGAGHGGPFEAWRQGVNPGQMYGLAEKYWSSFCLSHNLPPAHPEVMRMGMEAVGRIG